jgi:hypothetical protein
MRLAQRLRQGERRAVLNGISHGRLPLFKAANCHRRIKSGVPQRPPTVAGRLRTHDANRPLELTSASPQLAV